MSVDSSYTPQINYKKKFYYVNSYSMSIDFHHKINYKKLLESMLVGSSHSRHFESMLGGSYLCEY